MGSVEGQEFPAPGLPACDVSAFRRCDRMSSAYKEETACKEERFVLVCGLLASLLWAHGGADIMAEAWSRGLFTSWHPGSKERRG